MRQKELGVKRYINNNNNDISIQPVYYKLESYIK